MLAKTQPVVKMRRYGTANHILYIETATTRTGPGGGKGFCANDRAAQIQIQQMHAPELEEGPGSVIRPVRQKGVGMDGNELSDPRLSAFPSSSPCLALPCLVCSEGGSSVRKIDSHHLQHALTEGLHLIPLGNSVSL